MHDCYNIQVISPQSPVLIGSFGILPGIFLHLFALILYMAYYAQALPCHIMVVTDASSAVLAHMFCFFAAYCAYAAWYKLHQPLGRALASGLHRSLAFACAYDAHVAHRVIMQVAHPPVAEPACVLCFAAAQLAFARQYIPVRIFRLHR